MFFLANNVTEATHHMCETNEQYKQYRTNGFMTMDVFNCLNAMSDFGHASRRSLFGVISFFTAAAPCAANGGGIN